MVRQLALLIETGIAIQPLDLLFFHQHRDGNAAFTGSNFSLDGKSFIDDLIDHLLRQVLFVDAFKAQNDAWANALQQAALAQTPASVPDPPVTAGHEEVSPRSRSSSVYSRDTDGKTIQGWNSFCMPSTRSSSFSHRSVISYSPVSRHGSFSAPKKPGIAFPAGARAHERPPVRRLFSIVRAGLRTSSTMSSTSTDRESETAQAQKLEGFGAQQPQIGSRSATQQKAQQNKQHQDIMRIATLGMLRRRVNKLDLEPGEMVMLRSDLTTLVPIPQPQIPHGEAGENGSALPQADYDFFRERLARLVHRRLALLRLEVRAGKVRALEDWYNEVVDLIGWRDQSEAALSWAWRENDGFF